MILFWNVDTQLDFMGREGKLYVPGAEAIEPSLERLTAIAAKYGIAVVNTADAHDERTREISANPDYINTFPPHCIRGTPGAEYVPGTKPEDAYIADCQSQSIDEIAAREHRNIVLTKDAFDVFAAEGGSPHADKILEILKPGRAIVYGVAANVCVDFAVKGLLERGIDVCVVEDAIKGLPGIPDPTREWEAKGARMIKSATVETYLK